MKGNVKPNVMKMINGYAGGDDICRNIQVNTGWFLRRS